MRIAYISFEYPPDSSVGGIATYVAQAARMMMRRGHEVEVFASSPDRSGRFETNGVVVHWVQESDRENFGIVAGHVFAARNSERPFDLIEGPEFYADARIAVALAPHVPLVVKMHSPSLLIASLNAPPGFSPHLRNISRHARDIAAFLVKRKPLKPFSFTLPYLREARRVDAIESTHARQAAIVAPPCSDLYDYARSVWKIPVERIRLAPHPYTPTQDYLELQPREEGLTIGFVGRLEKRKGIEILTAAIPTILAAFPKARFRLVGAPCYHACGLRYDDWIRTQIPQYMERIEFTGRVPLERMAEVYRGLDICVFPSLWENFPNVCLEAMSAGRAIIAGSAGGMSSMLDGGRAGRLIPPRNPGALAREVIDLLRMPEQRILLGHTARRRVLGAYNEDVIGDLMERIYREAINCQLEKLARSDQEKETPVHE